MNEFYSGLFFVRRFTLPTKITFDTGKRIANAKNERHKIMKNNTLMKAFDLVAATRQKGFLSSNFIPLGDAKVTELKDILTQSLETKDAQKSASLRQSLLTALGAIDQYNACPATETQPISERRDAHLDYIKYEIVGYREVPNYMRPRILVGMQKQLYKSLKKHCIK